MVNGKGIIFHHIIVLTIAEANAKKINPRPGFCMRIKRRKKMGYSQVANGMIQRPLENNIRMVPVANQMKG